MRFSIKKVAIKEKIKNVDPFPSHGFKTPVTFILVYLGHEIFATLQFRECREKKVSRKFAAEKIIDVITAKLCIAISGIMYQ